MVRRQKGENISGWLAVDKHEGITAAKVVARVKTVFNAAKAGHGGTLDPLATGVLPIALGWATKTVSFAMNVRKVYEFEVLWGARTDTDDRDGVLVEVSDVRPAKTDILLALETQEVQDLLLENLFLDS